MMPNSLIPVFKFSFHGFPGKVVNLDLFDDLFDLVNEFGISKF